MYDTRTTTAATPTASAGLNRRSVLRTAAWTVPAVTIAAASPAYAASNALTLAFAMPPAGTFTVRSDNSKLFFGSIMIENQSPETTQNLRVIVALPTTYASVGAPINIKINEGKGGWTPPVVTAVAGNYVLTFTALTQLVRKSTTSFTFSGELKGTLPAVLPQISVTATATGFTQVSDTFVPAVHQ